MQWLSENGAPVLLFIIYIGHGVLKGNSHHLHCVDENGDESYNLEGFVRKFAKMPKIFTVGIYDCCRRKLSIQEGSEVLKKDID